LTLVTDVLLIVLLAAVVVMIREVRARRREALAYANHHIEEHEQLAARFGELGRLAEEHQQAHSDMPNVAALAAELQRHTTSNLLHPDRERAR
jgi:hypothetical protein